MVVPTTFLHGQEQAWSPVWSSIQRRASVDSAFTERQPLPGGGRKPSMVAAFSRNVEVMTAWQKFCVLCHAVSA